ncbi:MAG TPA: hypothetical protein H9828_08770 [Candidatus Alistipes intestinigallinarum]|uniref:Uncharacterized protein n=1 Tax=Candidatus Alistipes intestinigallinarum TaxID=2838440 RepID=A0A9D1Z2H5_9BACT|nr:hypothetical protein [Candidatus Alistipes intestinigallinarum]
MKKIMNILLGVLMVITIVLLVYAIATGGSEAAISANLMWGYFLFVAAIAAALFCAIFGMIKNPAGVKGAIISLALVIIVVGVSYFYAAGHTINIVDLQNNGVFGHSETVITEASIIVTYVAFVAAFVTAVVTEIWGAFK